MCDLLCFVGMYCVIFVCYYFGFLFYVMVLYCLLSWMFVFYICCFGMMVVEVGYMFGIVLLVVNIVGVFCGGWFNDWLLWCGCGDVLMCVGVIGVVCMVIFVMLFM